MATQVPTTTAYRIGQRVELHPGTDAWAMGDRFGDIVKVGKRRLWIKMDRSGKIRKMVPLNIGRIVAY